MRTTLGRAWVHRSGSFAAALLVFALLQGCATQPQPTSAADPVPEGRILSREWLTPTPGTSEITVKRDPAFGGGACAHTLYLDGRPQAEVRQGEKITLYVRPGRHVLGATVPTICGGSNSEVGVAIEGGERHVFRLSLQDGAVKVAPTAF